MGGRLCSGCTGSLVQQTAWSRKLPAALCISNATSPETTTSSGSSDRSQAVLHWCWPLLLQLLLCLAVRVGRMLVLLLLLQPRCSCHPRHPRIICVVWLCSMVVIAWHCCWGYNVVQPCQLLSGDILCLYCWLLLLLVGL